MLTNRHHGPGGPAIGPVPGRAVGDGLRVRYNGRGVVKPARLAEVLGNPIQPRQAAASGRGGAAGGQARPRRYARTAANRAVYASAPTATATRYPRTQTEPT